MISAIKAMEKASKIIGKKCNKICEYNKGSYLLLCGSDEDFYLMDKSTGKTRPMNPMEDFDTFIGALDHRVIYDFRK